MPPNTQRRPRGGGAAAQSLAGEPRSNSTALTTEEVLADRLPALIDRARSKLADARTSAEVLEAKHVAEAALHYAKVTDAANEAHADCLRIITRAEIRLAREIDASQERGEIAGPGQRSNVRASDISDLDDLGLDRRRVAEWRDLAEAGEQAVDAAIDEVVEDARTTKRAVTKTAVAEKIARKTTSLPASKSDAKDRQWKADRDAVIKALTVYRASHSAQALAALVLKQVPELETAVASSHVAVSTSPEKRPVASLAERPKLGEAEEAENAIIELLVRRLGSDLSVFTQLFKLTTIWRFEDKLAAAVKAAPTDHAGTNGDQQLIRFFSSYLTTAGSVQGVALALKLHNMAAGVVPEAQP